MQKKQVCLIKLTRKEKQNKLSLSMENVRHEIHKDYAPLYHKQFRSDIFIPNPFSHSLI